MIKNILLLIPLLIVCALANAEDASQEDQFQEVRIADPYIDIRTGPGRGYPIFHVVERGKLIEVLQHKTQWYKVRLWQNKRRYKEGWVHVSQLVKTLDLKGEYIAVKEEDLSDFTNRRWEAGALGGDFAGANQITLYGGYVATDNISFEVALTQALGNFSDSLLGSISLLHQPFPEWRVSPYVSLGTGVIHTKPKATLVQSEDRNDDVLTVGVGVKAYITKRFFFRMEYKNHVIQTSTDENEEVESWQLGFSTFF